FNPSSIALAMGSGTTVPMIVTILVLAYLAILDGNAGLSKWDQVFGAGVAEEIMRVAYRGLE
ncbi:hypothetical protein, partial [Klebsiella aerogenes]|uniref:hypothetical protein n=1 Tax=Klebsiella aerogenes TaxID=548 RepID=UPI0019535851